MTNATKTCWRCHGDGFFWRVPTGFNPFYAGAQTTAGAMYKVRCYECGGTAGGATEFVSLGEYVTKTEG